MNDNTLIPINTKDKKYVKLDKIRENHAFKVLKKRLKNNVEIEELNLENDLKLAKLNNKKNQLESEKEIRVTENVVNIDNHTIKSGKILKFWAMLVTLISTWLTISGGIDNFNKTALTKYSYIGAVILLQFTVYIIASQESRIKQLFYNHHWKCSLLKYTLVTVSIYSNYLYFKIETDGTIQTIAKLLICVALDLICVFLIGLAYDQISLNFFINKEYEEKNIILMWLDNFTFNFRTNVKKVYKTNRIKKDDIEIDSTDNSVNEATTDTPTIDEIGNRKYTMYLNYILFNKKQDESGYYIPSNNQALNYFKTKKTKTKFYTRDISNLREILYKESILIKPISASKKTYFDNNYLNQIGTPNFDENNSNNDSKNDNNSDNKNDENSSKDIL